MKGLRLTKHSINIDGRDVELQFFESEPGFETEVVNPNEVFSFNIIPEVTFLIRRVYDKLQRDYKTDFNRVQIFITSGFAGIPTDEGNLVFDSKVNFWTLSKANPKLNTIQLYLGH